MHHRFIAVEVLLTAVFILVQGQARLEHTDLRFPLPVSFVGAVEG